MRQTILCERDSSPSCASGYVRRDGIQQQMAGQFPWGSKQGWKMVPRKELVLSGGGHRAISGCSEWVAGKKGDAWVLKTISSFWESIRGWETRNEGGSRKGSQILKAYPAHYSIDFPSTHFPTHYEGSVKASEEKNQTENVGVCRYEMFKQSYQSPLILLQKLRMASHTLSLH